MFDPKELEDELDTACASALTVSETGSREAVLVFVRQTIRNQSFPSDHLVFAVQILDAVGIWTKGRGSPKASCGRISSGLGECQVERTCEARTLREVLGPTVLRELADNTTEFLDGVIRAFDESHVFPEDTIVEENELLVAMHFTVAATTASDWIDSCFHRREVIAGRHATRLHLFAPEMAKHFCGTLLFQFKSLRRALSRRICDQYVTLCLDGNARMATVFDNS